MRKHNWIAKAVIYQVNLRSLAAREPRNAIEAGAWREPVASPLAYVTRHLARVKRLGVNVLYLMPPYEMGMTARKGIGSPYAARDFRAVDPEYGSVDELAGFVRKAHRLGMKVIFDITPNHTARDHVWVRNNPDFYFTNADGQLRCDFDWWDTAKLNYGNPAMRRAMAEVLDHWLGFLGPGKNGALDGVDGFRFDMAHMISDLSFWNDTLGTLQARHNTRQLLFLAESYGAQNNLDLFARGMNAAYDDDLYKVWCFLFARDAKGKPVLHLAEEARSHADFAGTLAAYETDGVAGAVEHVLMTYEGVMRRDPAGPWLARYTDNHDEGRGMYRFGEQPTRAAMCLCFLTGHTVPFLLTGQEFGAANRPPIHERLGLCDKGYRVIGENGEETWVPGIEIEGNVFGRTAAERDAWYGFYAELIRLRRTTRELTRGRFKLRDVGEVAERKDRTVIAFERRLGASRVRCAVNLGPQSRELWDAKWFAGERLYGELKGHMLPAFGAIVTRSCAE